ncbi:TRAP transporter small permease subunit [Variovorax dokdonensis]|uniref:TRAP transporter small permease protein n=1 Tax=Variovorax dokdonensis TaxID=344883 RepID=A0ABT7N971_9BURK|nr:TRAP transporter small permease subunit [Variovorax dokdonensis]MDM0044488.1 TRAP transporter small permease subunit [Variovorax dokdonensis]
MASASPAGASGAGKAAAARRVVGAIDKVVDRIGRAAAWLTLAIALLMAVDVLLRYGFSIGSVWAQELEWHLLSPLVLLGMTYALQKGDHVRVDVFYARYSPRTQAAVDLVAALLAIAFAFFVVRYSIAYVGQSYAINEVSADPGGLTHRWLLKALIPVGFALFAVQAFAQAIDALLRLGGATAPQHPAGQA